jgi:hypothetical protein
MHEKSNEVPPAPNECVREPFNGVISFKIPQVIKGPKNTCFKNVVEKNPGKKKGAQKKGSDLPTTICLCLQFILSLLLSYIFHCR